METPTLLLLLLSIVLIYVFDTTFDRGLKVRLFCSPQWARSHTLKGFTRPKQPSATSPLFSTISISNISTKVSTTNPPWNVACCMLHVACDTCLNIDSMISTFDGAVHLDLPSATSPHFGHKPAFSRIPLNSEPRIVVKIFAKFTLPKRKFWKAEQKMKSRFSTDFSMVRSPNRVLTPLKSASNIRMSSFVTHSKIFVWEG